MSCESARAVAAAALQEVQHLCRRQASAHKQAQNALRLASNLQFNRGNESVDKIDTSALQISLTAKLAQHSCAAKNQATYLIPTVQSSAANTRVSTQ